MSYISESLNQLNKLTEASMSKIISTIYSDNNWAIISGYIDGLSENENLINQANLKSKVRELGYGFREFYSIWSDGLTTYKERALFIPKCTMVDANKLGEKFNQKSIVFKDNTGCKEICTTDFLTYKKGEVLKQFKLGNNSLNLELAKDIFAGRVSNQAASKSIKGTNMQPFTLQEVYEIEGPRPSVFRGPEEFRIF